MSDDLPSPPPEPEYWEPPLHPRQKEALQACLPSEQNLILLNGPRWSGKTHICFNAVCQHLWDTDRADIVLLSYTQSVGSESGVWDQLIRIFIPQWINAGFGMKWVKEPGYTVSKKPYAIVTNRHGTESRVSLASLRNEREVEDLFKSKVYSMIWINELSKWKSRKTFDTLKQCLRCAHLTPEQHIFLCDTNPDIDLGVQSWIYKLWYEFRTATKEELPKLVPSAEPEDLEPLQKALRLIEFTVDDNLSLSKSKKAQLRADFSHNQDLFRAYYLGEWVTASSDALFFTVFRPEFHIIGEDACKRNDWNPEILVPTSDCYELVSGHDPGATNYAWSMGWVAKEQRLKLVDGKEILVDVPIIETLDELVVVGEDFDLWDFVAQIVDKMNDWEKIIGRPGKTVWRNWSDRSVFDTKVAFSERLWHQAIFEASGGKISLMAAERGPGSVRARVDLWRKLLFDERAYICRSRCPNIIAMCKALRRGKTMDDSARTNVIAKGQKQKHIFDATMYWVGSELFDEMAQTNINSLRNLRRARNESTLVSV